MEKVLAICAGQFIPYLRSYHRLQILNWLVKTQEGGALHLQISRENDPNKPHAKWLGFQRSIKIFLAQLFGHDYKQVSRKN